MREMAAVVRVTVAPPAFPEDAARGVGQKVIVLPGFGAPNISTARLRLFLGRQGFAPQAWTCGVNLGPAREVIAVVERQLVETAGGGRVALIGMSLGGTIAREIAHRRPELVSRVITMGSPIRLPVVSPLAPVARAAARFWDADGRAALARMGQTPPVPVTAIVSPVDGVVDWRTCVPDPAHGVEVFEVANAHTTLGSNPRVQRLIAERLARD
jgi:pimeloyl-ACP methyl ester carboxylesterase